MWVQLCGCSLGRIGQLLVSRYSWHQTGHMILLRLHLQQSNQVQEPVVVCSAVKPDSIRIDLCLLACRHDEAVTDAAADV